MYIPPESTNLKTTAFPQLRIALQGASNTGKTWAALTFPSPVVANFDNGLTAFAGQDIIELPFYNPVWLKEKFPTTPNGKDAFLVWMTKEAWKITPEQTLVIDSWTTLQNAFDVNTPEVYSSKGVLDPYAFWAMKIEYAREICELFKGLTCHVVVTFHEQATRDPKTGALLEKIRPLMQGQFVNQLGIYFTDFFRQGVRVSADGKREWLWQVKSDDLVNCKTRMKLADNVMVVPAHFNSFKAYESTNQ